MSSAIKTIENPEVPGLECLLPPPPPPPPPPLISESAIKAVKAMTASSNPENRIKSTTEETSMKSTTDHKEVEPVEADISKNAKTTTDPYNPSVTPIPNANDSRPFALPGTPAFPEPTQGSYFVQPLVEQRPGVEQPWWVPTDSDNIEVVPQNSPWMERSPSWTEPNQKNPLVASKAKNKFFKRKSECIDPAQDAERVASVQRELSALMKPLNCDLCNAVMNSTLQAKLHYEGKPHQKKVSMFLNQSVKKIKPDDGAVTSTTSSTDWNAYCEVCKTWFTSQIDASQHYAGKKHIRATTGGTRQKTKKSQPAQPPIDPTGRFGIGMPFLTESTAPIITAPDIPSIMPVVSPVVSPANNYQPAAWPFPAFRCDLCGITANRLEQLETHKRGAKHMKMMKTSGVSNPDVEEVNGGESLQPAPSSIDYSIYRTPSGQYYCAPCNRSFHSEHSFAQHIESKKHKTQVNPKQPPPPPVKKANKATK